MMHNEDFRNDLERQGLVEPSSYVANDNRFSPDTGELQQRLERLDRRVGRLSAWLWVLTGVSIISSGLLFAGAYWLKRQNDQFAQQLSALNAYKEEVARIKTLESRISGLEIQTTSLNQNQNLLNQQVSKGVVTRLKAIENNISSLQNTQSVLQKSASNTVTRPEVDQSIQRALKQQNSTGASPTPSVSPSASPSVSPSAR